MLKTFKYRLYPTKRQIRLLTEQLQECRWLWNTFLAERKQAWKERQETITYTDQQNALPLMKRTVRPALMEVHAQVVQDVARRLDKAFDHFFRRLKTGENPGYPRFKGRGRYDSLTYPQWENGVKLTAQQNHLWMSKIGDVKLIYHRQMSGTPKTATIRRTATGKWLVTIACEWEPTPLPPTQQEVGIDVGLHSFATCSDTVVIANPHFFREEEKALGSAQRQHQLALDAHKATRAEVTTQTKADYPDLTDDQVWKLVNQHAEERETWRVRQKRRKVVARTHERIAWRRDDFTQQKSRQIVNACDLIALEDLTITHMAHHHALSKSIHDVVWGQFAQLIACKAAGAGRQCIAVNPAYTSQDCSGCGHRKTDLTLSDRIYHCIACGLVIGRDLNAALNILARGRACLGLVPEKPLRLRMGSRHGCDI